MKDPNQLTPVQIPDVSRVIPYMAALVVSGAVAMTSEADATPVASELPLTQMIAKPFEGPAIPDKGCSSNGCATTITVPANDDYRWTMNRSFSKKLVMTPYYYVKGKQLLFGDIASSCKVLSYGYGIAAEMSVCDKGPKSKIKNKVVNITDKPLKVRVRVEAAKPGDIE